MKKLLTFNEFTKPLHDKLVKLGYKPCKQLSLICYSLSCNIESFGESFGVSYFDFFRTSAKYEKVEYVFNETHNPLGKWHGFYREDFTEENLNTLLKLADDIITYYKKIVIDKKLKDLEKDF